MAEPTFDRSRYATRVVMPMTVAAVLLGIIVLLYERDDDAVDPLVFFIRLAAIIFFVFFGMILAKVRS